MKHTMPNGCQPNVCLNWIILLCRNVGATIFWYEFFFFSLERWKNVWLIIFIVDEFAASVIYRFVTHRYAIRDTRFRRIDHFNGTHERKEFPDRKKPWPVHAVRADMHTYVDLDVKATLCNCFFTSLPRRNRWPWGSRTTVVAEIEKFSLPMRPII